MEKDVVHGTLAYFNHVTRLRARGYFIESNSCESLSNEFEI
jgi:hypothetical protein